MIAEIGVPYAYYQFPEDTEQATPFVCFFFEGDNDFKADNSNYQRIEHLIIELYTDSKDFELEQTVESVLRNHGMVWNRDETQIDTEKLYEVVYGTDVIITEVNNG